MVCLLSFIKVIGPYLGLMCQPLFYTISIRVLSPKPFSILFITLIPKVKDPTYVSKFRPISLSNVLYRIFAKVLTNRLQAIMPNLISEHQSAFLFDRLISDNILVAFETLHYMRNHNKGKSGFMALKLDI